MDNELIFYFFCKGCGEPISGEGLCVRCSKKEERAVELMDKIVNTAKAIIKTIK